MNSNQIAFHPKGKHGKDGWHVAYSAQRADGKLTGFREIGMVRKDARRNTWSGWLKDTEGSTADVVARTRQDAAVDLAQMYKRQAERR